MQWDIWYDLAVLELVELGDPAKEKLAVAEKAQEQATPDEEDPLDPESQEAA
ncbi:MAG TPA: hypothetical protein VJX92_29480 [Methylomirabilota bacterium]|nr:hypothetical protein [Methylomirabilota bacterium]